MRAALSSARLAARLPEAPALLSALMGTLSALRPEERHRLLRGPDLRGFLSEMEIWSEVLRLGESGAPVTDRRTIRLFDRISRTEYLTRLVPTGRIDAAFPRRAARFALIRLRFALDDLSAVLLGIRLAFQPDGGRLHTRLTLREEPEQGRPAGRVDLGTFGGAAGPLGIEWPGRRSEFDRLRLTARLERGVLTVRADHGGTTAIFPLAGSPLRHPGAEEAPPSTRTGKDGARLVRRRLVPGTPILLAPALRAGPRRLTVGQDLPGIETRLARALRLTHLAWPAAYRLILDRTALIVPVHEPGLVSYSLAARPGVSFINVHRKSTLRLADDLLHETAHHLLHDVQETADLLLPGSETEEVQAFDSPWRGTRRPLHGILHGTYTFLFRAELFARLLLAGDRSPRLVGPLLGARGMAFLRRELRRELSMIGRALKELDQASRSGLLTPAGRALVRSLRAWRLRLARPGR